MPSEAEYRRQADALLHMAAAVENPHDRKALIDEASRWQALAMKAEAHSRAVPTPARRPAEPLSFVDSGVTDPQVVELGLGGLFDHPLTPARDHPQEQASRRRPFNLRRLLGMA